MILVIIEESPFSWGLISVIYNAIADINLQRYELKTHSVLSTKARNEVLMMLLEPLPQTFSFLKHKQTDICCTTSAPLSLFFFSHDGDVR